MSGTHPSAARRRLAAELRRLRLEAGLTGQELASAREWSQSKVSKIETGRTKPSAQDVTEWAAACNADEVTTTELRELVAAAQTEATPWNGSFDEQQRGYADLEQEATRLQIYQPEVIPGIFQTAEYARRLFMLLDRFDPAEIGPAVAARLDRQSILFDESKHIESVITEAALRWRPGPPSLCRAQLDRLASLMTLPSVTIGVLPLAAPATVLPGNQFVIFTLPGEVVVYVETYTAEVSISDPAAVAEYQRVYEMQRKAALFDDDAAAFIRRLSQDLTD